MYVRLKPHRKLSKMKLDKSALILSCFQVGLLCVDEGMSFQSSWAKCS